MGSWAEYSEADADRLETLAGVVDWDRFWDRLASARGGLSYDGHQFGKPPPGDVLVIFRAILFAAIFDLSDEDVAFILRDRISVREFVGLEAVYDYEAPPTADSIRLHRQQWARAGVLDVIAAEVDDKWRRAGHRVPGMERLVGTSPVRVGWIVDAQRRFLGGKGPFKACGAPEAGELGGQEAVAALTRAVGRMAARCHVMVYTQQPGDADASEGVVELIASVRPPVPLVLEWDAYDEDASALGGRALREGRHVVCRRSKQGSFEEHRVCGTLLLALDSLYRRPAEIFVAGFAHDGSMAYVVDNLRAHGLRAQGHRVAVVHDAVFATAQGHEKCSALWAGRGGVVSLHDLRYRADDLRQVSFADVQMEQVYEHIDDCLNASDDLVPVARLDEAVPWELFRRRLEVSRRTPQGDRGRRGRPDWHDALAVFKSLLLGAIHDLPDEELALQLQDRLTFRRFAGLGVMQAPPTVQQLLFHRDRWAHAGVMAELVKDVEQRWARMGCWYQGMQRLLGGSSPSGGNGREKG